MDVFMGLIFPSALTFAPKQTDYCGGQAYSISQNSALFSLLGTTFGGDGVNTFNLPDLKGRVAVGVGGALNVALGEAGGSAAITLTPANMPYHTHTAGFTATTGSVPITISVGTGGAGINASVAAAAINGTLTVSTATGATNVPSATNVPALIPETGSRDTIYAYGAAGSQNTANWPVGGTTAAQLAPVNGTISGNATTINGGTVAVQPAGGSAPFSTIPPYLGIAYLIVTQGIYPSRP